MNDHPPSAASAASGGARIAIVTLALAAIALVALSLRRPALPEYSPTPILEPGALVDSAARDEARLLTVDASDPERWRHVDLALGTVVETPGALGWDLAFRRFEARVNGGVGAEGSGGVADLGEVPLDSVPAIPAVGYLGMTVSGRDTTHALLDEWYTYSFTTHVLRPRARTFAVRTASGRHAALEFVSYYCRGAQPGCVTVRYRFLEPSGAR